jgi:predicted alpha-1,2-mannosidase
MDNASTSPMHVMRTIASALLPALIVLTWSGTALSQELNIARDLVNPFVGTGGHGHTFPGACVPFGMVQLSPDTRPNGTTDWDGASGYHYSDSVIYGFSHTHLSGTGVSDLCDVLLMPFGRTKNTSKEPDQWSSGFDHEKEEAYAGYYAVYLPDAQVNAELTATQRSGMHRYTFEPGMEAMVRIDLDHRDYIENASVVRVSDRELVGERRSSSWANDQRLFYCIRTSHPMKARDDSASLASEISAFTRSSDVFHFGDLGREPLIIKVGISAVSIEGARANLDAEIPHWDFDRVRMEAETTWNASLGRIEVKGGSRTEQRIFYTALYHTMIAPCIFNDVDGNYRGMDGQVHHADHDVYTIFSLWDTFRTLHPLMTLLEPERTKDWIRTMLLHYQHSRRLPVWELWANETDCMIGYHSVSVIADAYLKGMRGFDAKLALEAMVATAEQEHFGLKAYQERGFISSEDEAESVSKTLEYAYDDWCIARIAEALGEQAIAERFHARSRNWQNLFDPSTKFFRPRRNGGFIEPFDPYEVNSHFTEANAWQYSLFVPHDMERFIELLGNAPGLTERLDALFTANEQTTGRDQSDITGLIGQYAHGNEPSHSFAYLYNQSSRPYSTDVYVRKIMRELYHDAPDGLSGNEDCGQMSAWYVLSALGIYPVTPGLPEYTLGIPLFEEAAIQLDNGKILRISGSSESGDRSHVMTTLWNGRDHDRFRVIDHGALVEGGHLDFELGPRPGSAPAYDQWEEQAEDVAWVPVPIIQAPRRSFPDELRVSITCSDADAMIQYRVDTAEWKEYDGPLDLNTSTRIEARASRLGVHGRIIHSQVVAAQFTKVDGAYSIQLQSSYAPEYAADGDGSLIDGLRGGTDFRTGEWQGYRGQDIIVSIDLGSPKRVKRLGIGVLQDVRSWIWYPAEVEFNTSTNRRQWSSTIVRNTISPEAEGAQIQDLWTAPIDKRARYIEVTVRSIGPCPEWHPGAGETSWLFVDEILIEAE